MRILWLDETNPPGFPPATPLTSTACSTGDALVALREGASIETAYVALVTRLPLNSSSPAQLLEWARLYSPATKLLFFREQGTPQEAIALMRSGATYYFDCCPTPEEIQATLEPEFTPEPYAEPSKGESTVDGPGSPPFSEKAITPNGWRKSLVGASVALQRVADTIELIANRRSTVLILGETGTGKEVVARAIHDASNLSLS